MLQLAEPSTVYASLFIESIQASGTETAINFYEGGCRQRVRLSATGKEFVSEVEQQGDFSRQADLVDVGDHLIELESDAACRYSLKIDVVPTRLQGGTGL